MCVCVKEHGNPNSLMGYHEPITVNNRVQTKHEFDIAICNWKENPQMIHDHADELPWRKRKVGDTSHQGTCGILPRMNYNNRNKKESINKYFYDYRKPIRKTETKNIWSTTKLE